VIFKNQIFIIFSIFYKGYHQDFLQKSTKNKKFSFECQSIGEVNTSN